MTTPFPGGATLAEAQAFLQRYPDVQAIDIVLTDCHGIGRGKSIRRHELESLFTAGRGLPASMFAQDVAGDDVAGTGLVLEDGGGDLRCWPIAGTLGFLPATGRGLVLISMFNPDGSGFAAEPRHALLRQVKRAEALGFAPMGALEVEFYLVDRERDGNGRMQPARYPLTGRRSGNTNTMSVDELDEMSPFFDAVYEGAAALDLPLEALISEYACGQYELTIRYRDLMRAADDVILAKRLLRSTARRFGMEACFMAKPFGSMAGSGMHLHLSLADAGGSNLFADPTEGALSPLMLQAIAGVRGTIGETMAVLAPFQNSWRRFASVNYSPGNDAWGVENRTVAVRVPSGSGKTRHFEHRVAGVDANPYLVAAVTLGGALDGIAAGADPGPATLGNAYENAPSASLPRDWLGAIERLEGSDFARRVLGEPLHRGFVAIKKAEVMRMALEVSEAEWALYGFSV
ncbi:glutamine synthetase family protein [Pseudorhodobacter sp. MZDSW-24AT]|uniref:glutamine synthetase family protein n=1 Tax=Pseudorhodobacter sp. MZDSW-24AT TaxID=2052957 RepID=UPI000C1E464E|nr:glutamine synthetase family protein [Pseudorhodobacter sp. MZDSW-24AT]PJF09623.1 glutamine synthetase [Pseudorhodobacter sp. MZDSW-24AT]